jgi:hypothetical protein
VVWYYPPGRHVNAKNNKKGFATRRATVTTAGNKVQLTQPITASQALFHPENPNPSKPEGFATPHGSRELSSELVVWYYPPGRHVNAKNNKKGFATRQLLSPDMGHVQWAACCNVKP